MIPPDQTVEVTVLLSSSKEKFTGEARDKFQVQTLLLPNQQVVTSETDLKELVSEKDFEINVHFTNQCLNDTMQNSLQEQIQRK